MDLGVGRPAPLGATRTERGINFAVYARHADALRLLLFKGLDARMVAADFALNPRVHRTQDIWHAEVTYRALSGAGGYAFRAEGPAEGPHRYDAEKILLDPYARRVLFPPGHRRAAAKGEGSTLGRAPVAALPRAAPRLFDWSGDRRPAHPPHRRVIYELHVRGFTMRDPTVPEHHRGTYLGVIDKIPYLKALGVTTVELMPVHQFDPDENNYWGYMTLSFFAPHAAYAAGDDPHTELKTMVRALHAEGIEVLLDVVYNHTTEEDETGPTYGFRGLDNATYYLQTDDGVGYRDDSGTGNVLRTGHPQVRQLVLDSLRYWATEFRVDGFRYDLASILARDIHGDPDPYAALVTDIERDPVLAPLLHVAEPWDLAAYQVGVRFPGKTWSQWNDRFRDDIRQFVKSDPRLVATLMKRLSGSPDIFHPELPYARLASQSINFVVAHDGFSLNDVVSYNEKHNRANGHDNQDGAAINHNWNCGHEGERDVPPAVAELRSRQRRNLLTLLLLSNGVPMLYMGDEFANTQGGNNNPYNQDNETTWLNWRRRTEFADLVRFTGRLTALRRRVHALGQPRAWTPDDVRWFGVGAQLDLRPDSRTLAFALYDSAGAPELYAMINAFWDELTFEVQVAPAGGWRRLIDTARPSPDDAPVPEDAPSIPPGPVTVAPRSIVILGM